MAAKTALQSGSAVSGTRAITSQLFLDGARDSFIRGMCPSFFENSFRRASDLSNCRCLLRQTRHGRDRFLHPGGEMAGSCSTQKTQRRSLIVQAKSKRGLRSKGLLELLDPSRMTTEVCPCGGGPDKERYQTCCARFHRGGLLPTTALVLMRSRYTAYAKGLVDYLVETTHPDHPDFDTMRKDVRNTINKVRFKQLQIKDFTDGDEEAFVTFRFDYSVGKGIDRHITERSRFVKEAGRWLFRSTNVLEPKPSVDQDLEPEASLAEVDPLSPLSDLDL